jgi:hypothetical protein
MTKYDIIRMAREAGFAASWSVAAGEALERFAALVVAAERNRKWTQDHWTEYERSIAAAEREACAKVCEEYDANNPYIGQAKACAANIRARGNK